MAAPKEAKDQPNGCCHQNRMQRLFLNVSFDAFFPFVGLFPAGFGVFFSLFSDALDDMSGGISQFIRNGTFVVGITSGHGALLVENQSLTPLISLSKHKASISGASRLRSAKIFQEKGHSYGGFWVFPVDSGEAVFLA
jgi:hypothetical protein